MAYMTVADPKADGQVILVHPRQGFCLELSLPYDNDDWEVESFCPYIFLEKSSFRDRRKLFWYQQIYDLKAWTKVSSVQLGELLIRYKGKADKEEDPRFRTKTLFVVLQGQNEEQRATLTLINPTATQAKISPHQLLEVVVFDEYVSDTKFACLFDSVVRAGVPHLDMEVIGEKNVVHILENGKYVDVNQDQFLINRHPYTLPVNPKVDPNSPHYPIKKLPPKVYRASHFFLRLEEKCVPEVQRLSNGVYESGAAVFYESGNVLHTEYCVDLSICVKGSLKPKLTKFGLNRRQQLLISQHTIDGQDIGKKALAKEHVFENNRLLVNPTNKDNVEFIEGHENNLVIEIAPPYIWTDPGKHTESFKKAKWEASVDPVWQFQHRHEPEIRLSVQTLDERMVLGVPIQRFMVSAVRKNLRTGHSIMFLGILKLSCEEAGRQSTRCISFYLAGEKGGLKKTKVTHLPSSSSWCPLPQPPQKPMRVRIEVQEIRDDTLVTAGAMYKKFQDIKIETDNSNKKGKKK